MKAKVPGQLITCVLCGGDGYIASRYSHEESDPYGRPDGDSTCPSCQGSGRVPFRPVPTGPHWTRIKEDGVTKWFTYCLDGWPMVAHEVSGGKFCVRLTVKNKTWEVYAPTKNDGFNELKDLPCLRTSAPSAEKGS
jgi:hypothetical protein